ncbi:hypothetical protein F5878DRAFT_631434 [Lentinula raphanica]|uniref:Uncharacterized protein n=1 Tax=Lentinula raphanica TaxID=153919 RepID=A0AA38P0J9_9AGAR|nr:hypothetical protein F5878DRAFT_631434 [Lentinula raphanica]
MPHFLTFNVSRRYYLPTATSSDPQRSAPRIQRTCFLSRIFTDRYDHADSQRLSPTVCPADVGMDLPHETGMVVRARISLKRRLILFWKRMSTPSYPRYSRRYSALPPGFVHVRSAQNTLNGSSVPPVATPAPVKGPRFVIAL